MKKEQIYPLYNRWKIQKIFCQSERQTHLIYKDIPKCYIPNFAKCSLVPCSNSTLIPSPILIIISSVSILILTPFYHSPYESFLSSFPTRAHIPISAPYDYFSYLHYYDTLLLCFRLSHSVLSPNFYLTTVMYYLNFSLLINVIHLNTPLLLVNHY